MSRVRIEWTVVLRVAVLSLFLMTGLIASSGAATDPSAGILAPTVEIVKRVDKEVAYVGDTLRYTIGFTFTEELPGYPSVHVCFTDTIPAYTEIVPGSVSGAIFDGTQVYTSVVLWKDPIPPSWSNHWVTFDVRIVGFPPSGQIVNQANVVDCVVPGSLPWAWDTAYTTVHARAFLPLLFRAPAP